MKDIRYQTLAVKAAWRVLSDGRVKITQAVTESLGKSKYGAIKTAFYRATLKGEGTLSRTFLQPFFDVVPGFEEEVERQQILSLDPTNTDIITDRFAEELAKRMNDGGMLSAIEALQADLEEMKTRLANVEKRIG